MSSSSNEEAYVEPVNQENHELNLVRRFDFNTIQDRPQRGSVVLRFVGFEVVKFVGINPGEARLGDIAVEVAHSGFYTRTQVWLKVTDGAGGSVSTSSYRPVSISPPTLHSVAPDLAERRTSIPRLGDIWIPKLAISPNHFVQLYIPGVEDLYQEGDGLL